MARRLVGQAKVTATLTFALGGTQTVNVPVDRLFTGEFVALAGISKQSQGLLGVVSVREARMGAELPDGTASTVDVVLQSTSILSSVSVTVNVVAIGMM